MTPHPAWRPLALTGSWSEPVTNGGDAFWGEFDKMIERGNMNISYFYPTQHSPSPHIHTHLVNTGVVFDLCCGMSQCSIYIYTQCSYILHFINFSVCWSKTQNNYGKYSDLIISWGRKIIKTGRLEVDITKALISCIKGSLFDSSDLGPVSRLPAAVVRCLGAGININFAAKMWLYSSNPLI